MKRVLTGALCATVLLSASAFMPTPAAAEPVKAPYVGVNDRVWPDESIYFIMIDRFNNGDKANDGAANTSDPKTWHGGDLQGIIDKLDYIKSMGFTAIWITPHVKNTGRDYHGYGAVDFFDTDPHFGTIAQAKELVDKAHAKGLKVLFDIVVNHTGPLNPIVVQHPDWFHPKRDIANWNDPKQVQEGWIYGLPDFDQSKPEVRSYILDYSKFWIQQTGVDGFRLDTVRHVAPDFFTWYNQELQKVKPGFWLIGEVWESAPIKLETYQQAGVTAMLDFPANDAARKAFAADAALSTLAGVVANETKTMDDPWQMGAFLDNHDMTRFVTEAKNDGVNRLKLGLTWLFTGRSIPIVYYGTEIAMPGKNDPYNRDDFPWGKETNPDVRELVTRLNKLRADNVALRRGTVANLLSDQNTYAYARVAGEDKALVVLNNRENVGFQGEIDVSAVNFADGTTLHDALSGKNVHVAGGKVKVDVAARSGAVYLPGATVIGANDSPAPAPKTAASTPGSTIYLAAAAALAALVAGFVWWRQR
jgi:alpha-amylase